MSIMSPHMGRQHAKRANSCSKKGVKKILCVPITRGSITNLKQRPRTVTSRVLGFLILCELSHASVSYMRLCSISIKIPLQCFPIAYMLIFPQLAGTVFLCYPWNMLNVLLLVCLALGTNIL